MKTKTEGNEKLGAKMNAYFKVILGFGVVAFSYPILACSTCDHQDHQAQQAKLVCQSVAADNFVCLDEGPSERSLAHAGKQTEMASNSLKGSLLTKGDLKGDSLDLGNEFELDTALGDATALNGIESVESLGLRKPNDRLLNQGALTGLILQSALQGSGRPTVSVTSAGAPGHKN
jgi:hypothetical protein